MRILVTGASGFIGSNIVTALLTAGHQVVCAVRNIQRTQQQFPQCEIIYCDFNHDIDLGIWQARLHNIDAVINCVGILRQRPDESIEAIHHLTPRALFTACKTAGVRRVIHLSALGADRAAGTDFAVTKNAAEEYLSKMGINSVILRPSLVYGTGSYGGMSLFRALAALPGMIPVIDHGQQAFQPIHVEDLAQAVCVLLSKPGQIGEKLDVVGPEPITFAELLTQLRQWLTFKPAKLLKLPVGLIKVVAKIGDSWGIGPINSTSLRMLFYGNTVAPQEFDKFVQAIGFVPRSFFAALHAIPSYVQDRWHARLYFLNPLLRLSLALLWMGSGIVSLFSHHATSYQLLGQLGVTGVGAKLTLYSAAFLDILLGLLTLLNWRIVVVGSMQFIVVVLYTLICSIKLPFLWLDPFAPLLKNIPLLVATLIMMVLAEQR